MRIFKGAGPVILAAVVVIGWGFGLYYLFKMKNWDALTRPLPLALCAVVVLQVGLSTIGSSGVLQSLLGIVAVTVLLIGTVLPALSGVLSWIGRSQPGAHVGGGATDPRPRARAGRLGVARRRRQRRRGHGRRRACSPTGRRCRSPASSRRSRASSTSWMPASDR